MQHILRLGPLLSLLLLLGARGGVAVAQTPPALSPIAQLLQPYLLPESAAPAGFHLSRVQERTNVLIAGLLQDPEQIRPQVERGRITGVRQLFQQGTAARSRSISTRSSTATPPGVWLIWPTTRPRRARRSPPSTCRCSATRRWAC